MLNEKTISMLAACAVTLTGLAVAAPAIAKDRPVVVTAPADDVPTRRVSYRDLNLASAHDEKRLIRRVGYAVTDVCLESIGPSSALMFEEMRCRKSAWGGARPQIALAVQRAKEIAAFGSSSIPAVAISIAYTPR